jgi:hypothetical protein
MCKEVARLHAQISEAHATFGDTVDMATRKRSNNIVKKSIMSFFVESKALASILMKKIAEHQDLVKDISLERKENENIPMQTTMSLEPNLEDALRRVKARAPEESVKSYQGCDETECGRAIKIPTAISPHHASGVCLAIPRPPV